jgi:hypothetical protein
MFGEVAFTGSCMDMRVGVVFIFFGVFKSISTALTSVTSKTQYNISVKTCKWYIAPKVINPVETPMSCHYAIAIPASNTCCVNMTQTHLGNEEQNHKASRNKDVNRKVSYPSYAGCQRRIYAGETCACQPNERCGCGIKQTATTSTSYVD